MNAYQRLRKRLPRTDDRRRPKRCGRPRRRPLTAHRGFL